MKKQVSLILVLVTMAFAGFAQQAIHQYPFDDYYSDLDGNCNFTFDPVINSDTNRFGSMGKVLRVGLSDYSSVQISDMPDSNENRTVAFWIKHKDQADGGKRIFFHGVNDIGKAFGLTYNVPGNGAGANAYVLYGWGTDLVANNIGATATQWHHVVCIYENGMLKLYINGVYRGGSAVTLNTPASDFWLGKAGNAPMGFRNDFLLDDFMIYDYALGDSAIQVLYTQSPPKINNLQVTGITTDGATVSYSLDSKGYSTVSELQYGNSVYGFNQQEPGIVVDMGTANDTIVMSGLQPLTTYYLQIRASSFVGTTSTQTIGFTTPAAVHVGIAEAETGAGSLALYPNPAKDNLYITSPGGANRISLLDALGRNLGTYPLSNGGASLDVSSLPPGMYYIQAMQGATTTGIKKFIKL